VKVEALQIAPSLELALTYNREVRAGIERIWENVFDWEHLPVLHGSYFSHIASSSRSAAGVGGSSSRNSPALRIGG
jgi:DNA-binding XRE family transcriptional regulator